MNKISALAALSMGLLSLHASENPLLTDWKTPYGIPPFGEITNDDFIPAYKVGIAEHSKVIDSIIANKDAPTFFNTCAVMDGSAETMSKVGAVFGTLMGSERSDALDAIQTELDALAVAHGAEIVAKTQLFSRVAAAYKGDQTNLTTEEKRILEDTYRGFRRSGAELGPKEQARLKEINLALSAHSQRFSKNVLAADKAFKDTFGFSIAEYKEKMASSPDRELRRRMCEFYTSRCSSPGDEDNRGIAVEMLKLRLEKARLLGYETSADYFIEPRMAKTGKAAEEFLDRIMKAANAQTKIERAAMQEIMDRDIAAGLLPPGTKLQPWDWWYYAERLKKDRYQVDDEVLKRYFSLENVTKGMFRAAERLYGVRARLIENAPTYNPKETKTYRIEDADGSLVGIFMTDYRARVTKANGAWKSNIRAQFIDENGQDVRPIVINVANMGDHLTSRDVETLFHEFGHALQALMQRCRYRSSGSLNRDYVEVFSQFNEHFAFQPELLAEYAFDEEGNPIPDELVRKLNASSRHNQGFTVAELAVASLLDLKLHMLTDFTDFDLEAFEKKVCAEAGLIPEIGLRYRTPYFKHSFAGGYSAGYYSYLWSQVLEQDLFSIFEKSGNVWNRTLAEKFRRTFFERGDSEDPMVLFRTFAGRDVDLRSFFDAKGFVLDEK